VTSRRGRVPRLADERDRAERYREERGNQAKGVAEGHDGGLARRRRRERLQRDGLRLRGDEVLKPGDRRAMFRRRIRHCAASARMCRAARRARGQNRKKTFKPACRSISRER
jgi:hypothetical protein